MSFCNKCGKEIVNLAAFCAHCGSPSATTSAATIVGSPPVAHPATSPNLNPFELYLSALKKYATFQGRAQRNEYWSFFFINFGIAFALSFVLAIVGRIAGVHLEILTQLYNLATLLPSLAAAVRRLHDTGKSGWWIFAIIINIIFLCEDTHKGDNKYGADPKAAIR